MEFFIGVNKFEQRVYVTDCRDSLPSEITHFEVLTSSAQPDDKRAMSERFFTFYDHLRFVEKLGFEVCLSIGERHYETGDELRYVC